MQLTETQLELGCLAAAKFLDEDYERGLNHFGKYQARKQMRDWLAPCLLLLPDTVTVEELDEGYYHELFLEAARPFLLNNMRSNELFDNHSDEDLFRRISEEALEESADNLGYLTMVALEAALQIDASVRASLGSVASVDAHRKALEKKNDWDDALKKLSSTD